MTWTCVHTLSCLLPYSIYHISPTVTRKLSSNVFHQPYIRHISASSGVVNPHCICRDALPDISNQQYIWWRVIWRDQSNIIYYICWCRIIWRNHSTLYLLVTHLLTYSIYHISAGDASAGVFNLSIYLLVMRLLAYSINNISAGDVSSDVSTQPSISAGVFWRIQSTIYLLVTHFLAYLINNTSGQALSGVLNLT